MEPMALDCNGNVLQAMDGTPLETLITTGIGGTTSVVMASIAKSGVYFGETRGIDLR